MQGSTNWNPSGGGDRWEEFRGRAEGVYQYSRSVRFLLKGTTQVLSKHGGYCFLHFRSCFEAVIAPLVQMQIEDPPARPPE